MESRVDATTREKKYTDTIFFLGMPEIYLPLLTIVFVNNGRLRGLDLGLGDYVGAGFAVRWVCPRSGHADPSRTLNLSNKVENSRVCDAAEA